MNEDELADLFFKLGARDSRGWAHSQLAEGLPQLARFLFLRQAWKLVIKTDDQRWISDAQHVSAASPGGAAGPALTRMLSAGVSQQDISILVNVMQWRLLAGLCQLLDDPGDLEAEVRNIAWRLFQVDESDRPLVAISGLAESVLETAPDGNEMRSK
jgi:hypothetical protein